MRYRQIIAVCLTLTICIFTSAFYLPSAATGAVSAATIPPATEPTKTAQAQTDATTAPTDSTVPTEGTEPTVEIEVFYTEVDAVILAKVMWAEARGVTGTYKGVSATARKAAVAWCVLNRVDRGGFGDNIVDVATAPNQFAYFPDAPVTEDLLELAYDVLARWNLEQNNQADVGRTLPAGYLFFHGDGEENHFRKEFKGDGSYYDWRLPDPYAEK